MKRMNLKVLEMMIEKQLMGGIDSQHAHSSAIAENRQHERPRSFRTRTNDDAASSMLAKMMKMMMMRDQMMMTKKMKWLVLRFYC